jgi:hypothetical protein
VTHDERAHGVVAETQPSDAVAQYISEGRKSVPGWFHNEDAALFSLLSELQHEQGIVGDLVEIGVYQGASAILLGYLAGPDEQVVLNDLFGSPIVAAPDVSEDLAIYDGLELDAFLAQWHRFHAGEPGEIIVGPSSMLLDHTWDRPVRFIHIDGGHTYDVVQNDIAVAREALAGAGGIAVFDDVRAANAPGVAAAVWGAVESGDLVPFAHTWKLYATWDATFGALAADAVSRAFPCRDHIVHGHRLVQVQPAPVARPSLLHRWVPPALVPASGRVVRKVRATTDPLRERWRR